MTQLHWPSGKELADPPGTWGREIKIEDDRAGIVDDGLIAFEERIVQARRQWPEGRAEDFEPAGKRRFRDRATGSVFRLIDGCPLLGPPEIEAVDVWFVADGRLWFLIAEHRVSEDARHIVHGRVRGGEVVNGRVHWSES